MGNSNHADFFPERISKCGQRAFDSPRKGLQEPPEILSLSYMFTHNSVWSSFAPLHSVWYLAWNGKFQPCGCFFLEEFRSADSTSSTALQRAYEGHRRYNFYHFYFPSYDPFWYSVSPLYSVSSMEREIQTMRIVFMEKFRYADSAHSTALRRAYWGHRRYILYQFHFGRMTPFDIRL